MSEKEKIYVELLQELISIPSVNPEFKGTGEEQMSEFVYGYIKGLGVDVVQQEVSPGRRNVIARIGPSDSPAIMLEAHMDTVGVSDWKKGSPFIPLVEDGKIYGRGACDDKGSLAVFLACLRYFSKHPEQLKFPIVLAASVDEEAGLTGAHHLVANNKLNLLGAIIGEPTQSAIINMHKGYLRFDVETIGKEAHGSMPEHGINAIYRMADFLPKLIQWGRALTNLHEHPELGRPTMNLGVINGGTGSNTVPPKCHIEGEWRTIPGVGRVEIIDAMIKEFSDLDWLHIHLLNEQPPLHTSQDDPFVVKLGAAIRACKLPVRHTSAPYLTNAVAYTKANIPAVVFGPGNPYLAHMDNEYIDIFEMDRCYEILLQLLSG